jgi:glycosyltransferase involved in cell wall biosynthesis
MSFIQVSVVIISKNEEANIQMCIESVIQAVNNIDSTEIILVDSSSKDRTVEIARNFPIKIFKLREDWHHSPSAGKYTGFIQSKGQMICFIDGDMTLKKGWLEEAIKTMDEPNVAGVSGMILNEWTGTNRNKYISKRIDDDFLSLKTGTVSVLGGPAMFKRTVLNEVGCYHPFLDAGEEGDLSCRIISKGYSLIRLPRPMVSHFMEPITLSEYLKKYEWRYLKYVGKGLRSEAETDVKAFKLRSKTFYYALAIFSSLVAGSIGILASIIINNYIFIYIIIAAYILVVFAVLIIKKNIYVGLVIFLIVQIRAVAMVWGFLHRVSRPEEYPCNPIKIK